MTVRDEKGRFIKGIQSSPKTMFKKGQHWRKPKPFWKRDWLFEEYINKERSAASIAEDFSITESAILFWLRKHKIVTRSMSEIRKIKHWGLEGSANGMYGKTNSLNPNWKGGLSPERQLLYSSLEWKNTVINIWKRDKASCQRCGKKSVYVKGGGRKKLLNDLKFHIHHIVSFQVEELRADERNLVLLCEDCHNFVHSKNNINNDFIMTYEQFKNKYEYGD